MWHLLLHYNRESSAINTESFFLAPNGKYSPQEELEATIRLFYTDPTSQCKFPARKLYLMSNLGLKSLPEVECIHYSNYLNEFKADSVSLVYASGYLGNPASMFGHVMIKFNKLKNNKLLDHTFSYGAIVPDSDNKLEYIYNGITGGYDGHYANQMYHHQNLLYNESELRDLWEYELKLPKQDVTFLLAHFWELETTKKTYYFFTENCAYQLAKLLEMLMGRPLHKTNKLWVMPYDMVSLLNDDDIASITYHGSRQQDLYNKFFQLNQNQKQTVEIIIDAQPNAIPDHLKPYEDYAAKQIIDTLFDYYAFIESKKSGLTQRQEESRKQLLRQRFTLSPGNTDWEKQNPPPPHASQDTALFQVSSVYNQSLGFASEFRFRANYYDFLNINAARIPFSELEVFDVRVRYLHSESAWSLRELILFNITNLNTSKTGLPLDSGIAWRLSSGYKANSLTCQSCSSFYVDGFIGKATSLNNYFAAYTAISTEIRSTDKFGGYIKSGPEIGGIFNVTPNWAMSLKIGHHISLSSMESYGNYLNWEHRFFSHKNFDFRAQVKHQDSYEYSGSLSFYW
ncbi:DUF4105 domain-containing protein [Vibrio sp. S9_S30]|nr:DUF4105 domain-containing protein [Vibrio sp. S9_S30]